MRKVTVKLDRITVSGVLPNWSLQDIHDETGLIPRDGAMFLEREDKDGNTVIQRVRIVPENKDKY